jgi:DNA polymerase-3 subunit gamma/tau
MARHRTTTREQEAAGPPAPAEGYTVLARRYRPQSFHELVGQEPVARALTNALKSNRVAHAYLFTGARGVGKTSTARILAKALNCVHGPTAEPCGVCDICTSIATGEDVDVLEIDGASNRRIDEVRDIRSNVQYKPSRARYKIYIIDEVHMLTKEAFNALLKTLEEPPPHVKFIFATTEVDKVPITILSRCQRFDFAGISLPQVVARLQEIVEREGLRADHEALELVARRAGGSMRDAQSLLDQLLAFGGDRLTADQVHALLGTAGDERVIGLASAILGHDPRQVLDQLDEAAVGGLQLGELIDQLINYWRDLMVVHCGGTEGRDLSVPARHHETLRQHVKGISLDTILAGLDILSSTKARMRGSNHGRTLVEMALVRLSRLQDLVSLSQLAQWLRTAPAGGPAPASQAPRPLVGMTETIRKALPAGNEAPPAALSPVQPADVPRELTEATLSQVWPQILSLVGAMLGSELSKAGEVAILGPNTLAIRFAPRYNQHRDFCGNPERISRVEDALKKWCGRAWIVRVEEQAGSETAPEPSANGNLPPGDAQTPARRTAREEVLERVPLVRRAVDVFGAAIQRVDEGFGTEVSGSREHPERRMIEESSPAEED